LCLLCSGNSVFHSASSSWRVVYGSVKVQHALPSRCLQRTFLLASDLSVSCFQGSVLPFAFREVRISFPILTRAVLTSPIFQPCQYAPQSSHHDVSRMTPRSQLTQSAPPSHQPPPFCDKTLEHVFSFHLLLVSFVAPVCILKPAGNTGQSPHTPGPSRVLSNEF
jgi:hypothetical protein